MTHFALIIAISLALFRISMRTKTVLTGYQIGKLKEYEASLLKKRGLLAMELAKISSRENLITKINEKKTSEQ